MTISFDAIWIPVFLTGVTGLWATWIMTQSSAGLDWFFTLSVALVWPGVVVLGAWLIWALLT